MLATICGTMKLREYPYCFAFVIEEDVDEAQAVIPTK